MITADYDKMIEQAPATAENFMLDAIESISCRFSELYAKDHPELIGHFMQACAMDFASGVIAKAIQEAGERISEQIAAANESHSKS